MNLVFDNFLMPLPPELLFPLTFLFGLIIGSFLNVVIYRLHTGRSLNDRSHCLSCGSGLAWYELFPLISYLVLRGRCRSCGAWIPSRYLLVELLTGTAFVLVLWDAGLTIAAAFLAAIVSVLIIIVVYDLRHFIIPDEYVVALIILAVGLISMEVYESGEFARITEALGSAVIASAAYGGLWWISGGRWIGLGDVKLAAPLGALVGWPLTFSLVVWSFWIGAVVSVALLALQALAIRGKKHLRIGGPPLTIKSEVPFAPFLALAFVVTYFGALDVLDLTRYVVSLTLF